ncbi:MAG: TatD family hydrolase [Dysgonamonadaceae bacterium]|nr:TatD family hydrolase [Dysgonamonadaceae bacterium]
MESCFMAIDTHTHLFSEEFDFDIQETFQRAFENGIRKFCIPNIDVESIPRLKNLCDNYSQFCFPMMGLHPTCVKENFEKDLKIIHDEFEKGRYIAVGEIGIDLYWDKTFIKEQIKAFEEQLNWSIEMNLPLAIHTRNAFPPVFESLHKIGVNKLRGVFHSFGGRKDDLEEILKCEHFMLGINGVVTYKKAGFQDYLSLAPLERILLETDAPYLTPVPFRGKRNEPAYIIYIAQKIAEIYNLPIDTIIKKTTENACQLFGI